MKLAPNLKLLTTHFYEFYISKIPISKNLIHHIYGISKISELILFQNKQKVNAQKSSQELTWILELMIFEIYFEGKMVLNEKIQKILSKLFNDAPEINSEHILKLLKFALENEIQNDMKELFSHKWFNIVTNRIYEDRF